MRLVVRVTLVNQLELLILGIDGYGSLVLFRSKPAATRALRSRGTSWTVTSLEPLPPGCLR